jgi:hypothetical protein
MSRQRVHDDLADRERTSGALRLRASHSAALVPLTLHPDGSAQEVDVRDLQADQLADPETGACQRHDDGPGQARGLGEAASGSTLTGACPCVVRFRGFVACSATTLTAAPAPDRSPLRWRSGAGPVGRSRGDLILLGSPVGAMLRVTQRTYRGHMCDTPCPSCGAMLIVRGSQVVQLPGKTPKTYVDYECPRDDCGASVRVSIPAQRSESPAD